MTSAARDASRAVVIRRGVGETNHDVTLILAFVSARRMWKARDVEAASLVISTLILRMNSAAHRVSAMVILPYAALHLATQKLRLKVYSLEATNAGPLKITEAIR